MEKTYDILELSNKPLIELKAIASTMGIVSDHLFPKKQNIIYSILEKQAENTKDN